MAREKARGTVVLVRFPFTDLSGEKRRPAVVLTKAYGGDFIVACISSRLERGSPYNVVIDMKDEEFIKTGLKETSVIAVDKIVTLDSTLISGELGFLPKKYLEIVQLKLEKLFCLE